MKRIILGVLLLSLCASLTLRAQKTVEKGFDVNITVSNYANEPLMLVYMVGKDGFERRDIKIENNKAKVRIDAPLYTQFSIINRADGNNIKAGVGIIPGPSIAVFSEGNKDMSININMAEWPVSSVSGGELSADFMKLWSITAPIKREEFKATRKFSTTENGAEREKYIGERDVIREKIAEVEKKFVLDNPHSYISLNLLSGQRNTFEIDEFERRFNLLDMKLKALPQAVELAEYISSKKSTAAGKAAPDFNKMDKDGKRVKMSDYKGQYLLIDFWGTWCGPCRDSHPHLVELYKKYSPMGLRFLNVAQEGSLTAKKRWLDAITQDKLEWTQILNDEGIDECNMVNLFAITAFPTKVLISPDGKIVNRFVGESEELDSILKDIFKK